MRQTRVIQNFWYNSDYTLYSCYLSQVGFLVMFLVVYDGFTTFLTLKNKKPAGCH